MGKDCRCECPKCGFTFTRAEGVGMLFPLVYAETIQKAKSGELGKDMQNFFEEHDDGAIDASYVTICCDNCGDIARAQDLTMFVPANENVKRTAHGRWSVAMSFDDVDHVSKWDLKKDYREYAKYTHVCKKCGGNMHIAPREETLMCPKCKIPLEATGYLAWD